MGLPESPADCPGDHAPPPRDPRTTDAAAAARRPRLELRDGAHDEQLRSLDLSDGRRGLRRDPATPPQVLLLKNILDALPLKHDEAIRVEEARGQHVGHPVPDGPRIPTLACLIGESTHSNPGLGAERRFLLRFLDGGASAGRHRGTLGKGDDRETHHDETDTGEPYQSAHRAHGAASFSARGPGSGVRKWKG